MAFQLPHQKLGLSEVSYCLAFTQGYRHRKGDRASYNPGTALRKAYDAGRRAARKDGVR